MNLRLAFMEQMFDSDRDAVPGDSIVRGMRNLVTIHLAAGHLIRFWQPDLAFWESQRWRAIAMCAACLMCIVLRNTKWQRWTLAVALPIQLIQVYGVFPMVANHLWIETLLLVVLLMLGESEEENVLFRQFACGLAFVVFFYSGLQKLWYGTYFDGQYMATKIALVDHYYDFFAIFIPVDKLDALKSHVPIQAGSGPFRIDSFVFIVFVNLVWITEIAAGVLLFFRRTRLIGLFFGLLVMFGIELVAREVFFGILFVSMMMAFVRFNVLRWLTPVLACMYAFLVCVHFRVPGFPEFVFYP